jgi:hypothetical protein
MVQESLDPGEDAILCSELERMLRGNPYITSRLVRACRLEALDVLAFHLFLGNLGPWESCLEHSCSTDISIATAAHEEIRRRRRLKNPRHDVLRKRGTQVRVVECTQILWLRSTGRSDLTSLGGEVCLAQASAGDENLIYDYQ